VIRHANRHRYCVHDPFARMASACDAVLRLTSIFEALHSLGSMPLKQTAGKCDFGKDCRVGFRISPVSKTLGEPQQPAHRTCYVESAHGN
jgi:hypothetical protein